NFVSPFAADSARKSGSKPQLSVEPSPITTRTIAAGGSAPVVMGAVAPADAPQRVQPIQPDSFSQAQPAQPQKLREAVLHALAEAGQQALVSMLETGEWQLTGSELVIQVASSAAMIEMSLGG